MKDCKCKGKGPCQCNGKTELSEEMIKTLNEFYNIDAVEESSLQLKKECGEHCKCHSKEESFWQKFKKSFKNFFNK